jgi:rare lipoprotein A
MRLLALGALAALSVGLMGAEPASAKHERGSHEAAGKVSHAKKASYRKAAHKKAYKHKKAYRKAAYRHAGETKRVKRRTSVKRTSAYRGSHATQGIASYYWQGQKTASGARFNPNAMTAAHRTLPFGTRVLVTNRNNGRSVTVTINDRGPFIKGRVIDLSKAAAGVIGMHGSGLAPVSISVLGRG